MRIVPQSRRRCAEHEATQSFSESTRRRRYGYNRAHWRTLRLARIASAGGTCELRLRGCTRRATHVHLDPKLGGNHDAATLDDCRACCAQCSGAVDAPRSER